MYKSAQISMSFANENGDGVVPVGVIATAVDLFMMDSDTSDSSDGECDSDDEDFMAALYFVLTATKISGEREAQPLRQGFIERVAPNRDDFKVHFRMYPETFETVLQIIGPTLEEAIKAVGRKALPAHKLLLIALWFMATPDSYRSVATQFGVAKSTAYSAVRRVSYALSYKAPAFIQWPRGEEAAATIRQFRNKKSFPSVIGAIDGSHIRIRAPKEDNVSYINRKGVHSVVLQGVCDARSMFTHVYVGAPGSVHDARVFRTSSISNYQGMPEEYFPEDSHLLGDAAYPPHRHLMVPFKDNGHLTGRQKNYNYIHSSTRMAIERAFGLLKVRFRILLDCLPLTNVDRIPEFVMACCVLHNICILRGDLMDVVVAPVRGPAEQNWRANIDVNGRAKREIIMANLPMQQRED